MKVCIVARQPTIDPRTGKRYSDKDLAKLDSILRGPIHEVDKITIDLHEQLRIEFEKLYPNFGYADYEIISDQKQTEQSKS